MTGQSNRLAIERAMHDRLRLAARYSRGMGVMYVDVDDFGSINDSLGRAAGEQVLQVVEERLRASLRATDLIARHSDDEFVVIAFNVCDARHMATVATKLLAAVGPAIPVPGHEVFVTVSIGIAFFPVDGDDVSTLLRRADSAMYRVRQKGRNGFQFFAAAMNDAAG